MKAGLSLHVSVSEVLDRPIFNKAKLVAGQNGLHRRIRWVHVLETTDIESLIHGEEMILSTGIGFSSNLDSCLSYLRKLIDLNASCLCIEIGQYFSHVPKEMIEIANQSSFPILIFSEKVRFVDITQELHSSLINQHYQLLHDLEKISREFHRLTLNSQGTHHVLKLLHQSSNMPVIYYPIHGQAAFVPQVHPSEQQDLLDFIDAKLAAHSPSGAHDAPHEWIYKERLLLLQPVGAMGQTWAYIGIMSGRAIHEFAFLILDSASISIAQELLRNRYLEERKIHAETLWVSDLLHNRIKQEDQLKFLLGSDYHKLNQMPYHVCVIEMETEEMVESIPFHLSAMLRSALEKHSFLPLITIKNNRLDVIANDLGSKVSAKQRLHQVFQSLQQINADGKLQDLRFRIGVGELHTQFQNAHFSYQQAVQALFMYPYLKKPVLFYDELGIYQLLIPLREGNSLTLFIEKHLGPLIQEDQAKNSSLVNTLKVYLENSCSKQATAQKLSIVRQSLYYRLEKITQLLGFDLSSPERRITLQVAYLAYQFLYPEKI